MKIRKLLSSISFALAFIAMCYIAEGNSIYFANETSYLHTDRDIYIAGENIFFKLYLIDAGSHKLSGISKIAYLVLRNNDNIPIIKVKLKVDGGTANGSIFLPDSLKSGPYQLSVFTNWMRNAGEGSYFSKQIFIANRFDKDLQYLHTFSSSANQGNDTILNRGAISPLIVKTNKTEYNKREKIDLSFAFLTELPGDSANFSISVTEDIPGMSNDFTLYKFLNEYKINSGLQASSGSEITGFLPEQKGEIIQGLVIDTQTKKTVANALVFLSVSDSMVNLQYCYTDSSGKFRFLLNDYYQSKDLYFSVKDIPDEKHFTIIPEDKFEIKNNIEISQFPENDFLKEYIRKSQDIVNIQKTYEVNTSREIAVQFKPGCGPRLFYKPSYTILPADFVPLNDFAEIAKEIIPPQLNLRKRNETYTATMADENLHLFMDEEPVVFLDGVCIENVNQLIMLGSDKVKRIELVCSRYICGDLIFPGILAVFSKANEIRNIHPNSSTLHLQLEPYYRNSNFEHPDYSKGIPGNQPDFRQLLYWNPSLEISPDHNPVAGFYTSDHSGNYTIRIEGITSAGIPISVSTRLKVK